MARDAALKMARQKRDGVGSTNGCQGCQGRAEGRCGAHFRDSGPGIHRDKPGRLENAKHGQQWLNTLGQYAFPVIGETDVREIGLNHVLRILKPIWAELPETASRVRGRIETI
jgi:hypothetical protein